MTEANQNTEPVVEVLAPLSALEAQERAQTDVLISTAKRYPRSLTQCKAKALALATMDPDIAAECFYKLTRGGKVIEGPSIRLAEIIASTWQNVRSGARTIAESGTMVTAQVDRYFLWLGALHIVSFHTP